MKVSLVKETLGSYDDLNNLQVWLHSEGTEPHLFLSKLEQQQ